MPIPFGKFEGHSLYSPAIPDDPVVVDIGANHGAFARALSDARGGGRYVLVEPNEALVDELRQNLSTQCVMSYALAPSDGPITLHIAKNDQGSSLLRLPRESIYDCTLAHDQ